MRCCSVSIRRREIKKLSVETPAQFLVFDLLVDDRGTNLTTLPLQERRDRLERFAKRALVDDSIVLSPATTKLSNAKKWLSGRTGTDGVMAKRRDMAYRSGERTGMVKVKRIRT